MKNILLAILSGLLLAFGWPVNGFPLLLFFGFAPLLLAEFNIRNSEAKFIKWKVFGVSYLAFFIWNLLTTYWIYFSTPFGGAFAILANSLLMSIVFLIYHIVAKRTGFRASASFFISFWPKPPGIFYKFVIRLEKSYFLYNFFFRREALEFFYIRQKN